jgi:hypothetical protein
MIGGEVGVLEHRRDLVLAGRHLVVARFHEHAELVELAATSSVMNATLNGDCAEADPRAPGPWVVSRQTACGGVDESDATDKWLSMRSSCSGPLVGDAFRPGAEQLQHTNRPLLMASMGCGRAFAYRAFHRSS